MMAAPLFDWWTRVGFVVGSFFGCLLFFFFFGRKMKVQVNSRCHFEELFLYDLFNF